MRNILKQLNHELLNSLTAPYLVWHLAAYSFFLRLTTYAYFCSLLEWFSLSALYIQLIACGRINTKNGCLLSFFVVHENVNQDDTQRVTYGTHRMHDSFLCVKCNDLMVVADIIMDSEKTRLQSEWMSIGSKRAKDSFSYITSEGINSVKIYKNSMLLVKVSKSHNCMVYQKLKYVESFLIRTEFFYMTF